jgi:hypothetical protein
VVCLDRGLVTGRGNQTGASLFFSEVRSAAHKLMTGTNSLKGFVFIWSDPGCYLHVEMSRTALCVDERFVIKDRPFVSSMTRPVEGVIGRGSLNPPWIICGAKREAIAGWKSPHLARQTDWPPQHSIFGSDLEVEWLWSKYI